MLTTAAVLVLLAANVMADSSARCGIEMQGNAMFIKGTVGSSKPIDLAIDSGSTETTLDEAVARSSGFDLSMRAVSDGGNGRQELSVLRDVKVTICGKTVTEKMVVAYPLGFLGKAVKRQVDGIVGIEMFRKYVVILDYPNRTLEVIEPDSFSYNGSGTSVPVLYGRRLPYVSGTITPFGGGPIPVKLMLDSGGSSFHVDFYYPFEAKHHLITRLRDVADAKATMFTGERASTRGRIQSLRIGDLTVSEPEVQVLSQSRTGGFSEWDGTLGSGFFKKFRVIFDLPHDRVIFERPAADSAAAALP